MMYYSYLRLLPTVFLFGQALTHTWNEQLTVIENGIFTGGNGYPRGYVSRSQPGFGDDMMTYLLPSLASGRTRVDSSDLLCAPTQGTANQTVNYPQLQVSPGSYMAMKYLENGHVTLPQNQPGKPLAGGTVYVFGTTQPSENEMLTDVLQWTADGTGGNQLGTLLTAQNFDDGRCYQVNNGSIAVARQQEFPNPIPSQPESINEQWCETDVTIPSDLQTGSTYTVYWVWQWPTEPGAPGLPDGKDEYYTTCSDLDIVAGPIQGNPPNPLSQQDPQTAAVTNFQSRTAYTTNPLSTGSTASIVGV
jgi:hypothetical protein